MYLIVTFNGHILFFEPIEHDLKLYPVSGEISFRRTKHIENCLKMKENQRRKSQITLKKAIELNQFQTHAPNEV